MTASSADLVYRGCTGFAILSAGFAAGFFLKSWLRAPSHSVGSTSAKSKVLKGDSVVDLIGNTPLIRIKSLSEATGCEIYGKAEFTNPGGSVKDRVALQVSKGKSPQQRKARLIPHLFLLLCCILPHSLKHACLLFFSSLDYGGGTWQWTTSTWRNHL